MSSLVIDDLKTTLSQNFIVTERKVLQKIRPELVFVNDPAGTFTITLKEGATTLASDSQTLAEIQSGASWTPGEHHYGFIDFNFDTPAIVNPDTTYTIELSSSGYTFSESAYVAWRKPHENLINTFTATVADDFKNPFGYQLFGF